MRTYQVLEENSIQALQLLARNDHLPEPTLVVKIGKYGLAHKNVLSMMTMQKHALKGTFC